MALTLIVLVFLILVDVLVIIRLVAVEVIIKVVWFVTLIEVIEILDVFVIDVLVVELIIIMLERRIRFSLFRRMLAWSLRRCRAARSAGFTAFGGCCAGGCRLAGRRLGPSGLLGGGGFACRLRSPTGCFRRRTAGGCGLLGLISVLLACRRFLGQTYPPA